jgi:transcription elongation factor GreA
MEKLYLSKEGLDGLKADLKELNERRVKVAETIEYARSLGDLKENAEYHSAKEEQAMVHAKIKDLEDKITRAVPIEDTDIDTSQARLGATVTVKNQKTGREMVYKLVNHVEADLAAGKISTKSPVGAALLGTIVGDVAIAKVPAGDLPLEVLSITY